MVIVVIHRAVPVIFPEMIKINEKWNQKNMHDRYNDKLIVGLPIELAWVLQLMCASLQKELFADVLQIVYL